MGRRVVNPAAAAAKNTSARHLEVYCAVHTQIGAKSYIAQIVSCIERIAHKM